MMIWRRGPSGSCLLLAVTSQLRQPMQRSMFWMIEYVVILGSLQLELR
jgi:hypothetical protein